MRLRAAWARADSATGRMIQAHERAIFLHENAASMLDQQGDLAASTVARARADIEWRLLQAADVAQADVLAARALWL